MKNVSRKQKIRLNHDDVGDHCIPLFWTCFTGNRGWVLIPGARMVNV